jgi:hypothetical protein
VRAAPIAALSFRPRGSGNPAPPGCRSRPCRLQRDTRLPQTRRVRMPRGRKLTKSLLPRELRQPPRPLVRLRSRRRMAPAARPQFTPNAVPNEVAPAGPIYGALLDPHRRLESASRSRFSLPIPLGHGSPANELKSLANLIENCAILQNSRAPPFGDFGMAKKFSTPGPPRS